MCYNYFDEKTKITKEGVFMCNNSILQFLEKGLPELDLISEKFFENPQDVTGMILRVKDNVLKLALGVISDNFNQMDEAIRNSHNRKRKWNIVRRDNASLLTSLGTVNYRKTLFIHKETGERCYLLDKLTETDAHERITEDALAQIYEEAADSSYRKGGISASLTDEVSKQTVKNKLHAIQFPEKKAPEQKRKVKNLYIDADEDHVSLQFQNQRGDLEITENGYKKNSCIAKLVYVYEGKVTEGKRNRLVGTHYFSGLYEGTKENQRLWDSVNEYVEQNYELEKDGHIFINGDGGAWINRGETALGSHAVAVLDAFHLQKYINKAVSHMGDSKEDAKSELEKAVNECRKKRVEELFEKLEEFAESENTKLKVKDCRTYILGNWEKIKAADTYREELVGCSAEGHVSHLLSARLSSRPLGWSKKGIDQMSQLRAYKANGGDMLELAKAQRKEVSVDRKKLKDICSAADIMACERSARNITEKYCEAFTKSLASSQVKKMASIHFHVAGL